MPRQMRNSKTARAKSALDVMGAWITRLTMATSKATPTANAPDSFRKEPVVPLLRSGDFLDFIFLKETAPVYTFPGYSQY